MDLDSRARDIGEYVGCDVDDARARLAEGFIANHHRVAQDFHDAHVDQNNAEELLAWYRTTHAYVWELSAYHLDAGFNYMGMCEGIANHLLAAGKERVLALGDGVGDLTIDLAERGLKPTYHDLMGSVTAGFARFQLIGRALNVLDMLDESVFLDPPDPPMWMSESFAPPRPGEGFVPYDAVVALDFFEHVVNVEEWVAAVYSMLASGGIFLAQNAFGIGDDEHGGSIPMHLTVNNRFMTEWDPLLDSFGFINLHNGWRQKP